MQVYIDEFEKGVVNLTDCFIDKYFTGETDTFWVANEIGGVLSVTDYFFSLDDIVQAIKLGPTRDQLLDWYYYHIDCAFTKEALPDDEEVLEFNLKNWIQLGDKRPKEPVKRKIITPTVEDTIDTLHAYKQFQKDIDNYVSQNK